MCAILALRGSEIYLHPVFGFGGQQPRLVLDRAAAIIHLSRTASRCDRAHYGGSGGLLAIFCAPFALTGFATIAIAVFFLGAVQLISIGILGEYIGRIYDEIKGRPLYTLSEVAGFQGREQGRSARFSDEAAPTRQSSLKNPEG